MCIVGFHRWNGCKCWKCGKRKTHDGDHDWSRDCQKCRRCGGQRDIAHEWVGCTCYRCEKLRSEGHQWRGRKAGLLGLIDGGAKPYGHIDLNLEAILRNEPQWESLDAILDMNGWKTAPGEVIQCWFCGGCKKTRMKATVSSKIETADGGQGPIFKATLAGTPWNLECFANAHYCNIPPELNLNIGAEIAIVGVWKGPQFQIGCFCDPKNWEPY